MAAVSGRLLPAEIRCPSGNFAAHYEIMAMIIVEGAVGGSDWTNERIRKMTRIEFSDDEATMMRGILETYLHDLTSEIASTESLSFREDLKKQKVFIMDMLGRMTRLAA